MKKYVLASKNKHKAEEIKQILGPNYDIVTMDEAGIGDLDIIENGKTFEENAQKKAHQVYLKTKLPTIADDSGLCVDALNGKPGIYTARFAGENASDNENVNKLLHEIKDIPKNERGAKFVCVIAVIDPEVSEKPQFFRGECNGFISNKKCGCWGFGYDPVFYYPEFNCTLAELDSNTKNKISHRYKALVSFSNNL